MKSTQYTTKFMLANGKLLPKKFAGRAATVEFQLPNFRKCDASIAASLNLEVGASITAYTHKGGVSPGNHAFDVYATGDMAAEVLCLPAGSTLTAEVRFIYGTYQEMRIGRFDYWEETCDVSGLLITKLICTVTHLS